MCGGGSIPIEGALAFQNGFFIGGDNHNLAAERTANNLKVFDRKIQADSLQWDVTNIPLKGWFIFFLIKSNPSLFNFVVAELYDSHLHYLARQLSTEWLVHFFLSLIKVS